MLIWYSVGPAQTQTAQLAAVNLAKECWAGLRHRSGRLGHREEYGMPGLSVTS